MSPEGKSQISISASISLNDQVDSNNNNLGGVQHYQGEGYQQPMPFRRESQSGQLEIKIEYLYSILNTSYNLVLLELDTVVPFGLV